LEEQAAPIRERASVDSQCIISSESVFALVEAKFAEVVANGSHGWISRSSARAAVNELSVGYPALYQVAQSLAEQRPLFWINGHSIATPATGYGA
jgi:hypothetical protein